MGLVNGSNTGRIVYGLHFLYLSETGLSWGCGGESGGGEKLVGWVGR